MRYNSNIDLYEHIIIYNKNTRVHRRYIKLMTFDLVAVDLYKTHIRMYRLAILYNIMRNRRAFILN